MSRVYLVVLWGGGEGGGDSVSRWDQQDQGQVKVDYHREICVFSRNRKIGEIWLETRMANCLGRR